MTGQFIELCDRTAAKQASMRMGEQEGRQGLSVPLFTS